MVDIYLKTRQVADALQISVSSIKRWVDAGELAAKRTVGKHRLIALDEARRFALERNYSTNRLERLAEQGAVHPFQVDESLQAELATYLKEGRALKVRELTASTYIRLGSGARLADDLIQPVMEMIGHAWMLGSCDIYEEHQASQILLGAITELIAKCPSPPNDPKRLALGATPEGDQYSLSLLLGELALREVGWDFRNLGPNLPMSSFANAVKANRPPLAFLSVSHITDPASFLREYGRFYETAAASGVAVVIGGRALGPELRSKLMYTGFGDRMVNLVEFGRRLLPPDLENPVPAAI